MEYDDELDFKLIGRRVRDFRQMRGLTQENGQRQRGAYSEYRPIVRG